MGVVRKIQKLWWKLKWKILPKKRSQYVVEKIPQSAAEHALQCQKRSNRRGITRASENKKCRDRAIAAFEGKTPIH